MNGYDANLPLEVEYGPEKKFSADSRVYGQENTRRTRDARRAAIKLITEEREKHKKRYDERQIDLKLGEGDLVLLWNPLEPTGPRQGLALKLLVKYLGPFRVVV